MLNAIFAVHFPDIDYTDLAIACGVTQAVQDNTGARGPSLLVRGTRHSIATLAANLDYQPSIEWD